MILGAAVLANAPPAPYLHNPKREEVFNDMGPEVNVMGMVAEAGGIDDAMATFVSHHDTVSKALLNLSGIDTATGEITKPFAPRPDYEYQEYPRMLYHSDKRTAVVANEDEFEIMVRKGYRTKPYPVAQIAVGDAAAEKKALMEQLQKKDGELAVQNEMILEMREQMAALANQQKQMLEAMQAQAAKPAAKGKAKSAEPNEDDQ